MADAVELREFLEKVLSRHFEYHPDEFDAEYEKFTPAPTPSATPTDTSVSVPAPTTTVNG